MNVPCALAGRIIGKNGSMLKHIFQTSGADVRVFCPHFRCPDLALVLFRGTRAAVSAARLAVVGILTKHGYKPKPKTSYPSSIPSSSAASAAAVAACVDDRKHKDHFSIINCAASAASSRPSSGRAEMQPAQCVNIGAPAVQSPAPADPRRPGES